ARTGRRRLVRSRTVSSVASGPNIDQGAGAGLHQGHQLHRRVAGDPERGLHLPQPGPVTRRVGTLIEVHRRRPPSGTGRNAPTAWMGCATGPASTPHNDLNGAGPIRRGRSRSALAHGDGRPTSGRAAVSFAHTRWYPSPGNKPSVSTKYTPT